MSKDSTPFLRPSNAPDVPQGKCLILAHKHFHAWPHFLSVTLSSVSAPPSLCSLPPASLEHTEHSHVLHWLFPEPRMCFPRSQHVLFILFNCHLLWEAFHGYSVFCNIPFLSFPLSILCFIFLHSTYHCLADVHVFVSLLLLSSHYATEPMRGESDFGLCWIFSTQHSAWLSVDNQKYFLNEQVYSMKHRWTLFIKMCLVHCRCSINVIFF